MASSSLLLSTNATCRAVSRVRVQFFATASALRDVRKEIPDKELVYTGALAAQIKRLKAFTLATSVAGIALQPAIVQELQNVSTGLVIVAASTLGFFTFATPFLIHQVTKKYVTEITYDPTAERYTATTFTFLLQKNQHTFKAEDVEVPDIPGMFTTVKVSGKPLFLVPEGFYSREHYIRLMRLDKPLDLIGKENSENKES